MRRLSLAALLSIVLAACAATPPVLINTQHDAELNVDAARLIVVTVDNSTAPFLSEPGSTPHAYAATGTYTVGDQARTISAALAREYRLQKVREWPIAPLRVHCLVFAIPADADRADILRRLSGDRRVRLAQPMQLFSALSGSATGSSAVSASDHVSLEVRPPALKARYNDPYFGLQHGFAEVGAAAAQQWSQGEGVRVAIIDTGVATSHPDLRGRILLTRNFIDDDRQAFETDRHGTEVAGIIAADANNGLGIVGIAPAVELLALKACEPSRPASMDAVCNSFTLARALGAALDAHAQIVNLSLGGPADPLLAQIVSYGVQHGVIFVGAVPEDGRMDGFPLSISGVIAVDVAGKVSSAPAVLHAPGRDIVSTAPGASYDFVNGSSFAAAHVTGAIALLRAQRPDLSASTLSSVLAGDTINVCAALDAIRPGRDCMQAARSVATAAPVR